MPEDFTIDTPSDDKRAASSSVMPAIAPGFALIEEIGHGGMGVVYRARDAALDRDVAVKLLSERFLADSPAAQRFLNEARITGQLQHPGVPAVHQVGTLPDGRLFLAMKLIKGNNLETILKERTDPSSDRGKLLAVFEAVCQAVGYAHAHHVIHRDIKPANVMVGAFGEVQVMDWGLAKVIGADAPQESPSDTDVERTRAWTQVSPAPEATSHTQAGILVGTPAYIAPEQAGGEVGRVDERADVFGLGALLTAILTGKPPYVGDTSESLRLQAVRGKLGDCFARLDASGAEPELIGLCKRCLAFEPADRPRDAGEVARAVAGLRAAAEERAHLAEQERLAADVRAAEQTKRRKAVQRATAMIVGVLLLGVAGTTVGLFMADSQRRNAEKAQANEFQQRLGADDARKDAERKEKAERKERYRANMIATGSAIQLHNVSAARGLLDAAPEEHRNWEWRYFMQQVDAARHVIRFGDDVQKLQLSPDSTMAAVQTKRGPARLWKLNPRQEIATLPNRSPVIGYDGSSGFCFSPDGQTLAYTEADDPSVHFWDVVGGRSRAVSTGFPKGVFDLKFNPSGTRALIVAVDGIGGVYDVTTGLRLFTLKGVESVQSHSAFNGDGKRFATGDANGLTARLWNAETGESLKTLEGHISTVGQTMFNMQGDRILSVEAYPSSLLRLWDGDGNLLRKMEGHTNGVQWVAFSPDGTRLASVGQDRTVRLWDGRAGHAISSHEGHRGVVGKVSFSPDGKFLLSAAEDQTARLWDARNGTPLAVLHGHTGAISEAQYTADGSSIVTASMSDGTVRIWDARAAEQQGFLRGHESFVYGVAFHPDGLRVASAAWDGTVRIWDATTGIEKIKVIHPSPKPNEKTILTAVAFHPAGKLVASVGREGAIRFWDLATGNEAFSLALPFGHYNHDPRLAFSPNGNLFAAAGGWTKKAHIWNLHTKTEVAVLLGHTDAVLDVAFSQDGSWLASTGFDKSIRIWNLATKQQVQILEGHTSSVRGLALNPSGKILASGSLDGSVRLWDTTTWKEIAELKHGSIVYGLAFTPDGTRLACGCANNLIRLWDTATSQLVAELDGHGAYVYSLAFSPDGTRLVSGSGDSTVRVWDTVSAQKRAGK